MTDRRSYKSYAWKKWIVNDSKVIATSDRLFARILFLDETCFEDTIIPAMMFALALFKQCLLWPPWTTLTNDGNSIGERAVIYSTISISICWRRSSWHMVGRRIESGGRTRADHVEPRTVKKRVRKTIVSTVNLHWLYRSMRFPATIDDGRRTSSYSCSIHFLALFQTNNELIRPPMREGKKEGRKEERKEGRKSNAGEGNHEYLAVQNTFDPSAELWHYRNNRWSRFATVTPRLHLIYE